MNRRGMLAILASGIAPMLVPLRAFAGRKKFNVMDYGTFEPGANHQPLVNAAYDAAVAYKAGNVFFPALTNTRYNVTGIRIRHPNIGISTEGSGGFLFGRKNDDGVIFNYIGPPGGIAVYVAPPAEQDLYGVEIDDIQIEGNNAAHVGMRVASTFNSKFSRVYIQGCVGTGFDTAVVTMAKDSWCYRNEFHQIFPTVAGSTTGIMLAGDWGGSQLGGRNTSFCNFYGCHVTHANGTAYHLYHCDDVNFYGCGASRWNGTGDAIFFNGTNTGASTEGNKFFGFHGAGAIRHTPTGVTYPSRGNVVHITSVDEQMQVIPASYSQSLIVLDSGGAGSTGYFRHPQLVQ